MHWLHEYHKENNEEKCLGQVADLIFIDTVYSKLRKKVSRQAIPSMSDVLLE